MAEEWEKMVLTDKEILDAHEGELCRDCGRFIAKAQAKATWAAREPEIVAAYQAGEQAGIQKILTDLKGIDNDSDDVREFSRRVMSLIKEHGG